MLWIGIIVRDDDARERLLHSLKDVPGLILTVLESKGLEFDDVSLDRSTIIPGITHFYTGSASRLLQWYFRRL
jgi:hypothetical protein